MPSKTAQRGDVHWTVPGRKTPIAYSTLATSQLIGLLAEDGLTFGEAHDAVLYDTDAKQILALYVERGHGDRVMAEFGVRY